MTEGRSRKKGRRDGLGILAQPECWLGHVYGPGVEHLDWQETQRARRDSGEFSGEERGGLTEVAGIMITGSLIR